MEQSSETIGDSGLIEHTQRKFTRLILNVPPDPRSERYLNYHQRLKLLGLMRLEDRKYLLRILYITKLIKKPENIPSINNYVVRNPTMRDLRSTRSFMIANYTSALAERCPMRAMQGVYNEKQHLFSTSASLISVYFAFISESIDLASSTISF